MQRFIVTPEQTGRRLDVGLGLLCPDLSRSRIQSLIRDGHVRLNGTPAKPSQKLSATMVIELEVPAPVPVAVTPEAIPLDVLYEDADILALNKPAGLVVHPAAGHASGTLVNALLAHCPDLGGIGGELRPGIVHRLDRDTTGVMVVAKHAQALQSLVNQFRHRQVLKEYLALVWGRFEPPAGRIETLIGRSPRNRKTMSATPAVGRPAVTVYRTLERFAAASLLSLRIETGRTHQIRVHMAFKGHPVIGDTQYGRQHPGRLPGAMPARQMLHAHQLTLAHPRTGVAMTCTAPLPADFENLLSELKNEGKSHA